MSTTTSTSSAPWRATFLEHVSQKMSSPEFVLSTLHPAPQGSATPFVPRARYCIFRGMWTNLPENKHNNAPRNPQIYESDMPSFTTDVRMLKIPELFESSSGQPNTSDGRHLHGGSGGGGPVEAVWWVKDENVQWRIRGHCFVVGPDIEGEGQGSSGVRTAKSELGKRMRVLNEEDKDQWSWKKEVTAHFGNVSPAMRGSFKNPPPGRPKDEFYDKDKERLGEKVESLDDPVARENFRVAVIRPDEVEMLDLNPETTRREVYSYDASSGDWDMTTTWP